VPLRHRISRYLLALPGSVIFCLRYLPFRQAIRMPILVASTVARSRGNGTVRVEGPVRPGMITIGMGWCPLFDWRRSRGVWDVPGELIFLGPATISHGVKLSVSGRMVVGANVFINAEARISCAEQITIGDDTKISWDVLIMDSDAHPINGQAPNAPISIGHDVLIGADAMILKGAQLPDGAVVGASSCVTRSVRSSPQDLLAGNPAQVVRGGMTWER
jgi:acetyltransferase-like isoleucine patch superfamily enzyme